MKPQTAARTIVVIIAIFVSTWFSYEYRLHRQQIGREAFLSEQAKRYDHMLADPSFFSALTGSAMFWGGVFITYEGVSAAIYKLLSLKGEAAESDEHRET